MRFLLKSWLPPEFLRDEGEFLDPKEPWQTLRARLGRASGIALSYTMFLFVCLALLVIIGFTYDSRVRDSYWQQQRATSRACPAAWKASCN